MGDVVDLLLNWSLKARCRVVSGGLDIGSPTGATGQYVSLGNPVGGGFDNIPDIQEVQFALPGRNRGNQNNLRLDFTPTSNDSITLSTFLTRLNNLVLACLIVGLVDGQNSTCILRRFSALTDPQPFRPLWKRAP